MNFGRDEKSCPLWRGGVVRSTVPGGGGGEYPSRFWVGVCRPGLQM